VAAAWLGALRDTSDRTVSTNGQLRGYGPDPARDSGVAPLFGTVTIDQETLFTHIHATAPFRMLICGNGNMDENGKLIEFDPHSVWGRPWDQVTPYWARETVGAYVLATPGELMEMRSVNIHGYGWPLRALYLMNSFGLTNSLPERQHKGDLLIEHPANTRLVAYRGYGVALPTLPIWSGLFVNTFIFAAPLWLLFTFIPFARRHLRLRRHHCPACNYNLAGLSPDSKCPECGR
jgi:hypothetical protein